MHASWLLGMFGYGRLCLSDDSRIQMDQGDGYTRSGIYKDRMAHDALKPETVFKNYFEIASFVRHHLSKENFSGTFFPLASLT